MNLRLSPALLLVCLLPAFASSRKPPGDSTNAAPLPAVTKKEPAPEPSARPAAPAFVDVVTFKIQMGEEKEQLTVTSAPGLERIDASNERLSVLYDPATQHYTGLEHGNFTYWEFSWPEVRDAVQNTPRYATRLRDMGPELLEENAATPAATNSDTAPASASTDSAGDDTSGYVWHTDPAKKRISGIDCVHWVGETISGEKIDAWCAPRIIPEVEQALATLQTINEPIALVPVRNFMPPTAFVAWHAMTKGGVTPVLMTWGSDAEFNRFLLAGFKQRDGRVEDFRVPKVYIKTTLITMDGIGNQSVQGTHRAPQTTPAPTPAPSNPLLNNN